jgi:outer membrane protein OmpA-like peptidoglycan-associated protein
MTLLFRGILVLQILSLGNKSYSQQRDSIQSPALGIHFFVNDHFSKSSVTAYTNLRFNETFPGLALSFTKGFSKHFDWNVMLYGTFADSILKTSRPVGRKTIFVDANVSIRAKMFSNVNRFQPFLQGGFGLSQYKNNTGLFIPVGAGLQVNVFRGIFLTVQTKYSLPIGSAFRGYFSHSLGLSGTIGKSKKNPIKKIATPHPEVAYIIPDGDRDGTPDSADVCPEFPGLILLQGCPDRDKDSIPDKDDRCPDLPGEKVYFGCPIRDTDNDGIFDDRDKCIEIPGVVEFQGCPVPDRDKDGVRDSEDKCPDILGVQDRSGCPEVARMLTKKVDSAARNIFFETGSYRLLSKSFTALDTVASILTRDSNLNLEIDGHTDDVGSHLDNKILSEKRAKSVMDYLVEKGISASRLKALGFGEESPIVENSSSIHRAINRRVELRLLY